jgi:hypothetical protein
VSYAAPMRIAHVALLALTSACASSSAPASPGIEAGGAPGSPCVRNDDCAAPSLCAWPVDGGCNAQGHCVAEDPRCMTTGPVVCACDGTPVGLACIYGAGNAPAPLPSPMSTSCLPADGGAGGDSGGD